MVGPPLWKIWKSIGMISNPIYGKMPKMATKPPTGAMTHSWIATTTSLWTCGFAHENPQVANCMVNLKNHQTSSPRWAFEFQILGMNLIGWGPFWRNPSFTCSSTDWNPWKVSNFQRSNGDTKQPWRFLKGKWLMFQSPLMQLEAIVAIPRVHSPSMSVVFRSRKHPASFLLQCFRSCDLWMNLLTSPIGPIGPISDAQKDAKIVCRTPTSKWDV